MQETPLTIPQHQWLSKKKKQYSHDIAVYKQMVGSQEVSDVELFDVMLTWETSAEIAKILNELAPLARDPVMYDLVILSCFGNAVGQMLHLKPEKQKKFLKKYLNRTIDATGENANG